MPRNDSRAQNAINWIEIFRSTGVHRFQVQIPETSRPIPPSLCQKTKLETAHPHPLKDLAGGFNSVPHSVAMAPCGNLLHGLVEAGGADRDRTDDLKLAKLALS